MFQQFLDSVQEKHLQNTDKFVFKSEVGLVRSILADKNFR